MQLRYFTTALCVAAALALSGCGLFSKSDDPGEAFANADVAVTEHNSLSVLNYKRGREYSSQGRFELAREHYLLAYAAAGNDSALRGALARELEAVDLMIRTLR